MPIIVLLPHGETSSPTGYLTWNSCLDIIKKTVAIPSVLPRPREGYPPVLCGPENAPKRTATLIAKMLHGRIEVCRPALEETINAAELRAFAGRCLSSVKNIIVVSHTETIEAFIAILTATSDEAYADRRTEPFAPRQFTAIDTDQRIIITVEAPERILLL